MPRPQEGSDLSAESCIERLEAIPIDTYALFVYSSSKWEWYENLAQNKVLSKEDLMERARAAGDVAFEKTTDAETTASMKVSDAIRMTMLFFQTEAEDFIKRRSKVIKDVINHRRIEVSGVTLRFYKDHTQVNEIKSPDNVELYKALHTIHYPEDPKIDDVVSTFLTNNQLIQHFERTRTKEYFLERGENLKQSLTHILTWVRHRK